MTKTHYKKPRNLKKTSLKMAKLLVTFALISIFTIIGVFIGLNGIQAVMEWFASKWFCMVAVIALIAVVIAWWLWDFFRNMKRVAEDE